MILKMSRPLSGKKPGNGPRNAALNKSVSESSNTSSATSGSAALLGNKQIRVTGKFHFDRATGFRKLHGEAYKLVDEQLLAALGQMFAKPSDDVNPVELQEDMSWDSVMERFSQSPSFEKDGDTKGSIKSFTTNSTQVSRSITNFWQTRTKIMQKHIADTKEAVGNKAEEWFEGELVDDAEIRESLRLDIKVVTREQAQTILDLLHAKADEGVRHTLLTGAQSAEKVAEGLEEHEKRFLDVGVLRFPDFQEPHIKVYRIQLTAWTKINVKSSRIDSGIKGEYNHCRFRARAAFLNTFSNKALELAREEAVKFILLKSGSDGSGTFTTEPATSDHCP